MNIYGIKITLEMILKIVYGMSLFSIICISIFTMFIILLQKGQNYDTISKLRAKEITSSNPSIQILTFKSILMYYIFNTIIMIISKIYM